MKNSQGQLGYRIMIIGSGGAGKSTLARRLGEITGLPVIHLDAEYWQPGWVETPKDEWKCKVEVLASGDCWIIDGNYSGTLPVRLLKADMVIFLDYPRLVCLWRVCLRIARYRGQSRPDIGPGCPERFNGEFIHWVCVDFPRRSRPRLLGLLEECREGKQIVIFNSPAETRQYLQTIEREYS